MEDFFKQKIVWKRIGSILRFSYDESGALALDSTCFATGNHIKYLVAILNSKFGRYILKDSPKTGTGDLLISVQAIEPLKIPIPTENHLMSLEKIIESILLEKDKAKIEHFENQINSEIYKMFNFSVEEIGFIESQ